MAIFQKNVGEKYGIGCKSYLMSDGWILVLASAIQSVWCHTVEPLDGSTVPPKRVRIQSN